MINSQAIIGDLIPPAERGRYQGFLQSVFVLATVVGPLLGGAVTQYLSWRWVFYLNVPICLITLIVVVAKFTAPERDRRRPRIDWWGATLLSAGITSLILMTSWAGNAYRWTSAPIIGLAVAAVVLLLVFVVVERGAGEPVLPLRLFGNEIIRVITPLAFVVGFATLGATIFMPLFQQTVDRVSPTTSGLRMAPWWLSWSVTSVMCGRFITRSGRSCRLLIAGTFLLAVGMLALSRLGLGDSYGFQAAALALVGISLGLISSVTVLAAQNAAEPKDIDVATSTTTLSRAIGTAIGVAVFGAIFAASLQRSVPADLVAHFSDRTMTISRQHIDSLPASVRSAVLHGFDTALHHVFLTGAAAAAIAFLIALNVRDTPRRRRRNAAAAPKADEPGADGTHTPIEDGGG